MSLRADIRTLSAARCNDEEIAAAMQCRIGYVRQCLNRCATRGRYRRIPTMSQPSPAAAASGSRQTAAESQTPTGWGE